MDPPPDDEVEELSQYVSRLVLSSGTQRCAAARHVTSFACSYVVTEGRSGPVRRAERALLSALLDACYGEAWTALLLDCIRGVITSHPSPADGTAQFSAGAMAAAFVLDKVRIGRPLSLNSAIAAIELLSLLMAAVLARPEGISDPSLVAIASAQLSVLDGLTESGERGSRRNAAVSRLIRSVSSNVSSAALVAVYVPLWASADKDASVAGAGPLMDIARAVDAELYKSAVRPAVMDIFSKKILGGKVLPMDCTLLLFQPLFTDLLAEEWGAGSGSFAAGVTRFLKKAPETAARVVAAVSQMVAAAKLDSCGLLSAAGAGVGTICLRLLKATDEATRLHGVTISVNLLSTCADAETRQQFLTQLCDAVTAKGGQALTQPEQKAAVLQVLWERRPAEAGDMGGFGPASGLVDKMLGALEKEATVESMSGGSADASFAGVGNMALLVAIVTGHWLRAELAGAGAAQLVSRLQAIMATKITSANGAAVAHVNRAILVVIAIATEGNADLVKCLEPVATELMSVLREASKKTLLLHVDAALAFHLLVQLGKCQIASTGSSVVLEGMVTSKLWAASLGASSFLFSPLMHQFVCAPPSKVAWHRILYSLVVDAATLSTFDCIGNAAIRAAASTGVGLGPLLQSEWGTDEDCRRRLTTLSACLAGCSSGARLQLAETKGGNSIAEKKQNHVVSLVAGLFHWIQSTAAEVDLARRSASSGFKTVSTDSADALVADMALPCGLPSRIITTKSLRILPPPSALSEAVIQMADLLSLYRSEVCSVISKQNLLESPQFQLALLQLLTIACHPAVSGRSSWEQPAGVSVSGARRLLERIAESIGRYEEPVLGLRFDAELVKRVVRQSTTHCCEANRQSGHLATFLIINLSSSGNAQSKAMFENLASIVEFDVVPATLAQIDVWSLLELAEKDVNIFISPYKYLNDNSAVVAEEVSGDIKITNADRKAAGGKRKGAAFGSAADDEMLLEKIKQDKAKKLMASKGLDADGRALDAAQAQRQTEVDAISAKVRAILNPVLYALEGMTALSRYMCRLAASGGALTHIKTVAALIAARLTAILYAPEATEFGHNGKPGSLCLFQTLLCNRLTESVARQTLEALCELGTVGTSLHGAHADIAAGYALVSRGRADVNSTNVLAKVISFIDNRVVSSALSAGIKHCSYNFEQISHARHNGHVSIAMLSILTPLLVYPFAISVQPTVEDCEISHLVMMPGGEPALRCLSWLWPDVESRVVVTRTTQLLKDIIEPLLMPAIGACLVAQRWFKNSITDPTPEKLLLRISSQRALSAQEWEPLLGSRGVLNSDVLVRQSCLRTVENMMQHGYLFDTKPARLTSRLWLLLHDGDKDVVSAALAVFQEETTLCLDGAVLRELYELLTNPAPTVRAVAAKAIASALFCTPDRPALTIVSELIDIYVANVPVQRTVTDNLLSGKPGKMLVKEGKEMSKVIGKKGLDSTSVAPKDSKPAAVPVTKVKSEESTPVMLFARGAVASVLESVGNIAAIGGDPEAGRCISARREGGLRVAITDEAQFSKIFDFILSTGVVDRDEGVRDAMLTAGRSIIDGFGGLFGDKVQRSLQAILSPSAAPVASEDVAVSDARRTAVVVLLGAAGKHITLANSDESLDTLIGIIDTLISALDTPAASIQKAVADCLVPLVQTVKARAADSMTTRMTSTLTRCLEGRSYGIRRGAAYGLSALTKGLGVQSLKQLEIINILKEACANGSVEAREGSLFAFELLSDRLGLLFEPYVITVIPILLKSFSHPSNFVREAAQGTAGAIMGRLSAHGVKQVLMPILQSLPEEAAWKSRQEALRLLGSMAHCAPKQLAACLPQIIPRLVEAGADPHPKVKESAREAMADISSVIRNPEVAQLSPVLLAALGDPAKKTKEALEALMVCEFMHSIDAPSLGLLIPILGRALRDRAADLKRKSAMITGNMCAMIADQSVLVPYLPQVVPELKEVLLDPIPDVRTVAAKALASLVGGVGEAHLPDLIPWLMKTMGTEASSVERSGAAQGLAEVCHALGGQKLLSVLDEVLSWRNKKAIAAREGAMWLCSYLPAVYNQGDEFMVYISTLLPVVLSGLSDTQEAVREVAMRAAQVMVATQGKRHSSLILPSLQSGMSDDDWRVRQNSVSLLGELMYLLSDTKAIGLTDSPLDEDDDAGVSTNSRVLTVIRAILGDDTVDEVLAELYLARSDVGSSVRQNALQVWKSVVSQTPKTLVQIMPYLVDSIIRKLSDESEDRRTVAAKCLSDLVRKLGDRVLPIIVPHLRNGLDSSDLSVRRGVCMGLSEILAAAGKQQVDTYIDALVPALEVALCDETSADIRSQGAIAFQTLIKVYGVEAIDQVLPKLLQRLEIYTDAPDSDDLVATDKGALLGVCELVGAKPRDVLDTLLPTLLSLPMTASHALILKEICPSARGHLQYHLSTLVPQLIKELKASADREIGASLDGRKLATHNQIEACATVVMGSTPTAGVNFLVIELGKQIDKSLPNNVVLEVSNRRWAMWLLAQFLGSGGADYSEYLTIILRQILSRAADAEPLVLDAILLALRGLTTAVPADDLMSSIDFIQSCIATAYSDAKHRAQGTGTVTCRLVPSTDGSGDLWLPLFTVPKALDHLMPLFIHTLMNGNTAQRESAACAIGEFAGYAEPSIVLKPHLIKTTGPLIRVAGDRFPSAVKFAIINALCTLLRKGGAMLKAFVPQLQTTFIKAFSDPSRQVRSQCGRALVLLMALNPKPDVVLIELSALCVNAEAAPLRASALEGIARVLEKAGDKTTPRALSEVALVIVVGSTDADDSVRSAALQVCSQFGRIAPADLVSELGADLLQKAASEPLSGTYSVANSSTYVGSCCAAACLVGSGSNGDRCEQSICDEMVELVRGALSKPDGEGAIKVAVQSACAAMFRTMEQAEVAALTIAQLMPLIIVNIGDGSNYEVRRTALVVVKEAAKSQRVALGPHLAALVTAVMPRLQDLSMRVKKDAERALKRMFDIRNGDAKVSASMAEFVQGSSCPSADAGRALREIFRKTLCSLPDASDDEDDPFGSKF